MRFEIEEKAPVKALYWKPGFAWFPVEATQGPALPNVVVWLEPIGVRKEMVYAVIRMRGTEVTRYCTKERMLRDNEFPNTKQQGDSDGKPPR